ncbi:hypothetical protein [Nocardia terpenica]|uniref:hypothetical protein n=1 Tax=Nocardia terpenica TaxID=455432 RepID=UPI0018E07109|nr:hypothetical protein [Nocardia terpenica]
MRLNIAGHIYRLGRTTLVTRRISRLLRIPLYPITSRHTYRLPRTTLLIQLIPRINRLLRSIAARHICRLGRTIPRPTHITGRNGRLRHISGCFFVTAGRTSRLLRIPLRPIIARHIYWLG